MTVMINGNSLSLEQVVSVARCYEKVVLDPEALEKIKKSRSLIERILAEKKVVYGVNTGFGLLRMFQFRMMRSSSFNITWLLAVLPASVNLLPRK